ncbi:MAG: glycosyl hydrolase family 16 [Anaerolinea sp.]|nr:glycosyl hydrolase family 16 [Anaerolinea sp.]
MSGCAGGGSSSGPGDSPSSAPVPASLEATSPAGPEATSEVATRPATPAPTSPTPTLGPPVWKLVWSDEFDGPAGSPPDRATWLYDIGGSGWGNDERQFYTDYTENVALDGKGNLLLTARVSDGSLACHYGPCEYTSGRLLTRGRNEFQYGRMEARIKVPVGAGLWPAFWMLGADIGKVGWPAAGEIDIMEYVGRWPNRILGTIHGPGYYGSSGLGATFDLGKPVADDFRTFAIEWRPGRVAWFVDGVQYYEATPADAEPSKWVFDHPFFLLLNVAVGGTLGGPVAPETVFPQSMVVDYVRVYQDAGS